MAAKGLLGSLVDRVRKRGQQLRVNLPSPKAIAERVAFGPQPVQKGLAQIGRTIQKFGLPKPLINLPGEKFVRGSVEEAVRSPGRTLERVFTPKGRRLLASSARKVATTRPGLSTLGEPAVEAAFDISDITPIGLVAGTAVDVAKPLARFAPGAAKAGRALTKVDDLGERVLRELGEQFSKGRTLRKQAEKGPGLLRSFRKNFLDRFSEVERVDRTFFRDLRLLSGGGSGRTEQILTDGTLPILQRESGRLEDFSKFLGLNRLNELVNVRGIERQLDKKGISAGLEALEKKHGPEVIQQMSESGKQLRTFLNSALDMYTQSGMITKKAADAAKAGNKQYITFETIGQMLRDAGETGQGFARQSFNVARQGVIKNIGTSKSGISDPLESTFQKLFRQIEVADRNSILNDFVSRRGDLATKVKEGAIIPADKGTIELFQNGKKISYQVDKEISDAVKNVDAQALPNFLKFLTIPTQIIKKGAVEFNPAFTLGVNPVRDLQDALVSTGVERGGREAAGLLSSYGDSLAKAFNLSDEFAQWRRSGGAFGGFVGAEVRQAPETAIKRTAERGQKFLATVKTPGGLLKTFKRASTAIEEAPRLARFRQEAKGVAEGGLAPFAQVPEQLREAAFESRTGTLDFARAGNVSRFINQIIPFFNVGIQGTARMLSLAKNNPARFSRTIGIGVGLPATTVYLNNRKFQDFNDIQDFERENNMIIMLRDRTPEERADGKAIQAIKVPLGNIIKPFYNTVESFLDHASGSNPQRLDQLGLNLLEDLSPIGVPFGGDRFRRFAGGITPQAVKPIVEQAANINLFTGAPIVPQRLEGVEPEEQFTEKTGLLPRAIGKVTGISPARIQAFASSAGGTVGRAIFAPSQGVPSATFGRFFGPREGAETTRQFEDIEKVEREAETVKLKQTREAEGIFKQIKGKPQEAKAKLLELAKENPELAERVLDIAEEQAKGLTSIEKKLGRLGVANGARAKVISNQLSKLKTNEEKKSLLIDLSQKRILTDEVLDQVLDLQETLQGTPDAERTSEAVLPKVGEAKDGLLSRVQKALSVSEVIASDEELIDMEVEGDFITITTKDKEGNVHQKSESISKTEGLSQALGGLLHNIGGKLGLPEAGISEALGFVPPEEKIAAVERFKEPQKEIIEDSYGFEPGSPEDPFIKKGFILDSDGTYRKPDKSRDTKAKQKDLSGFRTDRNQPSKNIKSRILETADKYDVDPHLIAGILHQESGFVTGLTNENKGKSGNVKSTDRGLAQINDKAFPNISTSQAFNDDFAVDFIGQRLSYLIDVFDGDIEKAILAYNRGERGAREGRPDVNDYVNGVLSNLTPRYRKQIGLTLE